jgi:hypothetical protein
MNKIFYVVGLVLLIIGTTAATTILTNQPAQAKHCSLPNGNAFPGQGGVHSNPDSNGGGCILFLSIEL